MSVSPQPLLVLFMWIFTSVKLIESNSAVRMLLLDEIEFSPAYLDMFTINRRFASLWCNLELIWANTKHLKSHTMAFGFWLQLDMS